MNYKKTAINAVRKLFVARDIENNIREFLNETPEWRPRIEKMTLSQYLDLESITFENFLLLYNSNRTSIRFRPGSSASYSLTFVKSFAPHYVKGFYRDIALFPSIALATIILAAYTSGNIWSYAGIPCALIVYILSSPPIFGLLAILLFGVMLAFMLLGMWPYVLLTTGIGIASFASFLFRIRYQVAIEQAAISSELALMFYLECGAVELFILDGDTEIPLSRDKSEDLLSN